MRVEGNLTVRIEKTISRLQQDMGTVKTLLQENKWEMMDGSGYYKHVLKLNNRLPQNTEIWCAEIKLNHQPSN